MKIVAPLLIVFALFLQIALSPQPAPVPVTHEVKQSILLALDKFEGIR